ncbi:hypothetical protein BMS3Abin15_00508 [bacterium BMS3Abin15]|nr:hypothetical protein BMS3Abin15_00508 [bacterium BMS3Abin15]HDH07596.1 hypothetical protein [Candidatus Moranbacteria bacterium]HDZ85494.1 hypothetical protein [Candidatus Moranbacteria bacterium]
MWKILKFIIWIAGIIVVGNFVLNYFGYKVNTSYFEQNKANCQKRIEKCTKELVEQGTKNAKCDINCVNPELIIKRK